MRAFCSASLLALAALANGCTIHVVEHPGTAQAWSNPPPAAGAPYAAPVAQPLPPPAPPPEAEPRRVASRARPSSYGRVTTAPAGAPATGGRVEPRPSQPVTSVPVVTKPKPQRPSTDAPVADTPKGRYPFRLTRPEPRRPEATGDRVGDAGDRRVRPPLSAVR